MKPYLLGAIVVVVALVLLGAVAANIATSPPHVASSPLVVPNRVRSATSPVTGTAPAAVTLPNPAAKSALPNTATSAPAQPVAPGMPAPPGASLLPPPPGAPGNLVSPTPPGAGQPSVAAQATPPTASPTPNAPALTPQQPRHQ